MLKTLLNLGTYIHRSCYKSICDRLCVYKYINKPKKLKFSNHIFLRFENKDKDSEKMSREELLYKYFNLLDDDDIVSLYNIYQNDFKMFGYSFQFRGLKLNV